MTEIAHVYLHVPFSRGPRPYRDDSVLVTRETDPMWAQMLSGELRMREALGVSLAGLETVLVGGGSPSMMGSLLPEGVHRILGSERIKATLEWTVEANPEDLDAALIESWTESGVSRINLGVQTLHDRALAWLGLEHSADLARAAMCSLSQSDIASWGVDLLYGLSEEVDASPTDALAEVIAAGAPHISLYELVAEVGTPLASRVAPGDVRMAGQDRCADQYLSLCAMLKDGGYVAYEMTGFALPRHRSRHADALLEGRGWLGLGPGAHSQLDGVASWNLRDWEGYSSAVRSGQLPEAGCCPLSLYANSPERLWFALRRSQGILRAQLSTDGLEVVARWVLHGLGRSDASRVWLTPEGWLQLDALALELAEVEAEVETHPRGRPVLDS